MSTVVTYIPKLQGRITTYIQIAWALKTPVVLMNDVTYFPCIYEDITSFLDCMPELEYKPDIADCDNFAFIFKGIADTQYNSIGIVFGKFGGGLHAWNVAVTNRGVYQVEPQNKMIFKKHPEYRPMIVVI